ncbi:hypothetical protein INT44_004948 [Umbelopsis vinacea]|uniref:Tail specific protease domain-containing protein n=1 Tax=Umbelopsis vinacea TaxID=44442 RepID=A0A8H7Q7H0_9FUNG|nr:hypothetical protein INT44_004948 [Umbelopsis vinacea]
MFSSNLFAIATSVLLATLPSFSSAQTSDPCAIVAGKHIATFAEAKACLDYFPYNQTIAAETIDTVRKITDDLYIFNEIAATPPKVEGLSIVPVNISKALDIIQKEPWKSDRAFQDAIALILDKVHDAHLVYSPHCYRQFIFWQPIQLNSLIRGGRQIVNVAYVKDDLWADAKKEWTDCEVTHIDDVNAMEMVVNYAVNNNGESKDVNTCLNNIMNSKDYFHGWDDGADDLGYHRFLPAQESHKYTLQCPKNGTKPEQADYDEPITVTIPWVAQIPTGFSDADTYWDSFCSVHTSALSKRGPLFLPSVQENHIGQAFDFSENSIGHTTRDYTEFLILDGDDSDVGLIDIQSFSVASEDKEAFVKNFTRGLQMFAEKNVKKIIFDFSGNGGGDACAGEFFINSFFNSTPDYYSDVKYSPLVNNMVKKAFDMKNTKWMDYKSNHTQGSDWYTNPVTYKRGNTDVKFSQPVSLSCESWNSAFAGNNAFNTSRWNADDLLILSDGRCGSTCAIVVSRLRLIHNVPALGLGGIRGNRMQFASFPGGESERLSSFLTDLQSLDLLDDPEAPKPFPERADMGWTFREVYRPNLPDTKFGDEVNLLEYNNVAADCRMYYTDENASDPKKLLHEVAALVKSGQCPLVQNGGK